MLSFVRRRLSALFEGLLASLVVATLAALVGLAAFTLAAPGMPSGQQTREGILSIRHGDDFTGGHMSGHFYFLMSGAAETELVFEGAPPDHSADGARIRIQGINQGGRFLVAAGGSQQVSGPSAPTIAATGTKRVAIVLFNFSNDSSEPYTPAFAAGVAFTNPNSVAAYYAETSHGQLSLSGDVFGWYTIPESNANCATSAWASSANATAAAAGVDLSAYDNVVYAFPATTCGWSGQAQLPGRSSWLTGAGAMTLRVMAHELGHNFGTHHASALNCNEGGVRVALSASSTNCTTSEYGDPFTVMGSSTSYQHSNYSRGNFGWLQTADTVTVTAAGDYTLNPIESADVAGVDSLMVARTSGTFLTLEFRQPLAPFDTFPATSPVATGVSVRVTSGYSVKAQSLLVDSTPLTTSLGDAALIAGRTLVDPLSGVSITTLSTSSTGAIVRVAFGASPTATASPPPTPSQAPTPTPTVSPTPSQSPSPTPMPTPMPTQSPDLRPPTSPTGLRATSGKGKKLQLVWSPSSDDVGVAGYRIYRDGAELGMTSATTIGDVWTGRRTTATYWVIAYDAAGNLSAASATTTVNAADLGG
jgi:M6 family metalloprotease-like protein